MKFGSVALLAVRARSNGALSLVARDAYSTIMDDFDAVSSAFAGFDSAVSNASSPSSSVTLQSSSMDIISAYGQGPNDLEPLSAFSTSLSLDFVEPVQSLGATMQSSANNLDSNQSILNGLNLCSVIGDLAMRQYRAGQAFFNTLVSKAPAILQPTVAGLSSGALEPLLDVVSIYSRCGSSTSFPVPTTDYSTTVETVTSPLQPQNTITHMSTSSSTTVGVEMATTITATSTVTSAVPSQITDADANTGSSIGKVIPSSTTKTFTFSQNSGTESVMAMATTTLIATATGSVTLATFSPNLRSDASSGINSDINKDTDTTTSTTTDTDTDTATSTATDTTANPITSPSTDEAMVTTTTATAENTVTTAILSHGTNTSMGTVISRSTGTGMSSATSVAAKVSLPKGAQVGIGVGAAAAGLCIFGLSAFILWQKRKLHKPNRDQGFFPKHELPDDEPILERPDLETEETQVELENRGLFELTNDLKSEVSFNSPV